MSAPDLGTPARDVGVDRLRGLAVVLMLGANVAPVTVPEPRPFAYRVLSTFCAPAFVLLFGMMFGRRTPSLGDAWKRAAIMLIFAALLDLAAWGLTPFVGFDILYLVGVATPLVALASRLDARRLLMMASIVVFAAPLLREAAPVEALPLAAKNALSFGWFPLFPWIGVALFGVALSKLEADPEFFRGRRIALASVLIVAGCVEWYLSEPVLREKGGYAELFYPPHHFVLAPFVGAAILCLEGLRTLGDSSLMRFVTRFGRRSLWVYVLHILVIGRVIHPLVNEPSLMATALSYLGLVVGADISLRVLDSAKLRPAWAPLRLLLGG